MTAALSTVLPDEIRAALRRSGRRRRFGRGEVVCHEGDRGDTMHLVERGTFVARSSSLLGHVLDVNVFRPGTVFGEMTALGLVRARTATIVALTGGETLSVTSAELEELRSRGPEIDRFLLAVLAERNRALTEHVVELLFTPVDQRVIRRLLLFAELSGVPEGETIVLSQAELAALAGTTRATVNRALRRLERDGLLELGRGRIVVVDNRGLRSRAR